MTIANRMVHTDSGMTQEHTFFAGDGETSNGLEAAWGANRMSVSPVGMEEYV